MTRETDFREIRRLLGDPVEYRPTPDTIVSNQIAAEQYLLNRLTGTGKPWTSSTINVNSVINQAEYNLMPTVAAFGKALFAYRDLGGNTILGIPFTDYATELQDQRYEIWLAQPPNSAAVVSGEKIAFFRNGNVAKMRIYPVPTEVKTYSIVYATGALDWKNFTWTEEPAVPEFSRLRQLYAALATVAKCEWVGLNHQENAAYRRELRSDLKEEYLLQDDEFKAFIRNPQHEPSISEVGYYWE